MFLNLNILCLSCSTFCKVQLHWYFECVSLSYLNLCNVFICSCKIVGQFCIYVKKIKKHRFQFPLKTKGKKIMRKAKLSWKEDAKHFQKFREKNRKRGNVRRERSKISGRKSGKTLTQTNIPLIIILGERLRISVMILDQGTFCIGEQSQLNSFCTTFSQVLVALPDILSVPFLLFILYLCCCSA